MKYSFLAILAIFFLSCNNDPEEKKDYSAQNEAEIQAYVAENHLDAKRTSSGLYYVINEAGTGKQPTAASNVTVSYKGYYTNKKALDQSTDAGVTFNLQQVIKGWTEGIPFFKEGGSGILLIPAHLAYGSDDYKGVPAGSVLIFEIKLLAVEHSAINDAAIVKYIADNNLNATKTASGLYYVIDEEGTGKQPASTANVTVAYKGYYTNKTLFDQGSTTGVSFNLQGVIKGWTEGIPYFKEGGSGKLLVPSALGYGSYDYRGIPGGSVLIFDVKLISVN
ncbi:FKBP-type peptidyl-prolyl cis-trans isomerase [Flavobacterium aquicola]|uniref:Peptidyl-prolyl cis-trans isomerase n=1 Tax=Flavobacterium aquicola TaxID=1682742 RepID=A0A3E0E3F4_9FLAO|nr:FKBP-type peptidyl-prolyl cis-trans isomerase [Flavobacterium aquicola]REG92263.1 FKBP-type peptidyl-prolyl isomerase-like protein [Flavobacterium aquicola]